MFCYEYTYKHFQPEWIPHSAQGLGSVQDDRDTSLSYLILIALGELGNEQVEEDHNHQKQEGQVDNCTKPSVSKVWTLCYGHLVTVMQNRSTPESSFPKDVR